jgi:hypothetical protein
MLLVVVIVLGSYEWRKMEKKGEERERVIFLTELKKINFSNTYIKLLLFNIDKEKKPE